MGKDTNDFRELLKALDVGNESIGVVAVRDSDTKSRIAALKEQFTNFEQNVSPILANVQKLSGRIDDKLAGKRGALDLLLGDEAPRLVATLARANQLLASLDGVVQKADRQLLGEQGLLADTQAAVKQVGGLLGQARDSLEKVDAVLKEAEVIARNARVASTDLDALRADVDASLRKVQALVNDINRLWPLKRDPEIKLP
jgi:phospholipid/cholesterol/gamma-HCH transport system substrate-binding protein